MGMDASLAVERARSRSRTGRKRTRSEGPAAMEVDAEGAAAGSQPPKKRLHSAKSRFETRLLGWLRGCAGRNGLEVSACAADLC